MRKTGRRTLAAVAAGALGAGLLIGLGATPANAALTGTDIGAPTNAGNNYRQVGADAANRSIIAVGSGATVTLNLEVTATNVDDGGTVTFAVLNAAGTPQTLNVTAAGNFTAGAGNLSAVYTEDGTAGAPATTTASFTAPAGAPAGWTIRVTGTGASTVVSRASIPLTFFDPTLSGVTAPAAIRAGQAIPAGGLSVTGTNLLQNAASRYALSILAGPAQFAGADDAARLVTAGNSTAATSDTSIVSGANITFPVAANGLGYQAVVGLYQCGTGAVTGVAAAVGGGVTCASGGTPILVGSDTVNVGGPIAGITLTPANATITDVAGATQLFQVTAVDAGGRSTIGIAGDSVVMSSSAPGVATIPVNVTPDYQTGTMTALATRQGPGTTTITARPNNIAVTQQTATLNVVAQAGTTANTSIAVSQANTAETTTGNAIWARTYDANLGLTSLTFNITGLTPSLTYAWAAQPTGVNIGLGAGNPRTGSVVSDASGNATVTLPVGATVNNNSVQLTINGAAGVAGQPGANQPKSALVTFLNGTPAVQTPVTGTVLFAAPSSTVPVTVTVADQYGAANANAQIQIRTNGPSGTVQAQGATNAAGSVTLNVTAPATGQTVFTITGTSNVGAPLANVTVTVSTGTPAVAFTGGVSTATQTVSRFTPGNSQVGVTEVTPVVVNVTAGGAPVSGAQVTFTGSAGVKFFTTNPVNNVNGFSLYSAGDDTPLPVTTVAGQATIWAYGIRSGTATVTATVGGASAQGTFQVTTFAGDARNLTVTAPADIKQSELGVVTFRVTDEFGNPVQVNGVPLRFDDTSIGTFGDGLRQIAVNTDANGQAQVTVRSNTTGKMTFQVGASGFAQFGAAANRQASNSLTNDAPGFAASTAPRTIEVEVKAGVADKSIAIAGTRTTVSGKPGIEVLGVVTGIENGKTVKPYFRFPGQTSYTEGSARPVIKDGEFIWERKTGKKIYVYVTNDDGEVKSNRVIIQAP